MMTNGSVQIQNILDIRATESSKQINSEMQKLTAQGINENKLMKKLTKQSAQDTRSMMTIALISAVFLPATFLATLFGSNFFDYSQADDRLTIASNFWVYVVIAVGFSGATVLLWYFWRRRRMQAIDDDDVESHNELEK
jgi:Mg2+ and Co2+ transporter CorA